MEFVAEYGLNSLKSKVEKWVFEQRSRCGEVLEQPKELIKKYELVQDEQTFKKWIDKIIRASKVAIDTETTGLNIFRDKIVGFSMSVNEGEACYVPLFHKTQSDMADLFGNVKSEQIKQLSTDVVKKYLKPVLESKSILKIGHNIKFDMHFLAQIVGEDANIFPIEDTAVLSYDLDSSEHGHGLDELADIFLNYQTIKYEDVCGTGKNKISFEYVLLDKALEYAAEDADITLRLYNVLKNRLISERKIAVYENIDRPLISVLKDMEQNGIMIDTAALMELNETFAAKMQVLEKEIYNLG